MQNEPNREDLEKLQEYLEEEERKNTYKPRPKWQVVMAWVLVIIVILGVINVCYWQIHGIPDFLLRRA